MTSRKTKPGADAVGENDNAQNENGQPNPAADETAAAPANNGPAPGGGQPAAGESEADALREQVLRLRADYDNYRKRVLREKEVIYEQANAELMEALLPALDHLMLGIAAAERQSSDGGILAGMNLIYSQLNDTLARFGLSRLEVAGKPFDPLTSEAVMQTTDAALPDGMVAEEIRPGYMLKGKLLRPAQVVVNSAHAGRSGAEESGSDKAQED